mmetsp:Transcript_99302/g.196761  ORF Transcript_99302/g.196761 Transcript_99302/m.196761 type:complete len:112 (+) Transcript_99302:847-1182(+)
MALQQQQLSRTTLTNEFPHSLSGPTSAIAVLPICRLTCLHLCPGGQRGVSPCPPVKMVVKPYQEKTCAEQIHLTGKVFPVRAWLEMRSEKVTASLCSARHTQKYTILLAMV